MTAAFTMQARRAHAYEESLALRVHAGYTPPVKWRRRMACTGLTELPRFLCAECPVRLGCLTAVMHDEQHLDSLYIVGHAAISEKVRRKFRLPQVRLSACGTNKGYARHRAASENACEPCLKAHAADHLEAKKARTS